MDKFAMIIFGASGDLTKRKLMPALYSLYRDKRLTGSFTVLGIGRTVYSDEDYRSYILGELQQFVKAEEQNLELMSSFVSHLYYLPMDPAKVEGYSQLRERLVELTKEVDPDNLLFYLATPPSLYGVVPLHLKAAGLNTPHSRIIVEKPFGYDLESALELNKIYSSVFDEHQIYRIDHFWARRRRRMCLLSVSPMVFLSRYGIVIILIMWRLLLWRIWVLSSAEVFTRRRGLCGIWCRIT